MRRSYRRSVRPKIQMTPDNIQEEYDFTAGTRGPVAPLPGGIARITIRIIVDYR